MDLYRAVDSEGNTLDFYLDSVAKFEKSINELINEEK